MLKYQIRREPQIISFTSLPPFHWKILYRPMETRCKKNFAHPKVQQRFNWKITLTHCLLISTANMTFIFDAIKFHPFHLLRGSSRLVAYIVNRSNSEKMEVKEQTSINNIYNKLLCAGRMRRDIVMAEVGQREVICREYLEIYCRHDIFTTFKKSPR